MNSNNDMSTRISTSQLRSVADIARAIKAKSGVAASTAVYSPPITETQNTLVRIWAEMLSAEKIGIDDNFFDLGGHSLLAAQIVSKMRTAFSIECQLQWLFDTPTIRTLAEHVDCCDEQVAMAAIPMVNRDRALPLSFSQQRLWFLDQYQPGRAFYNIPLAANLSGALKPDVLIRAFNEVVRRHESLRTVFAAELGTPRQVVLRQIVLKMPLDDLSEIPFNEREASVQALVRAEADQPFDLMHGPLLRTRLVKLDGQEHILLLTLHHIIADGWSMGVLIKEVAVLYSAFLAGKPSPLPELPVQYVDFAAWQRGWLQGDLHKSQVDYWKAQLDGAPALLELPTDRPRPSLPTYRGATWHFDLSDVLTNGLTSLAREQNVTLFMLLAAAFNVLLARHTNQDDICLGTPVAGRNRTEFEGLIGFFTNTLVLRTKVIGDEPFTDLLARVRETALGAYGHQDIPFEHLVEALNPDRNQSHSPLFQAMLILQNAPRAQLDAGDLLIGSRPTHAHSAKFDITCSLWEGNDRLAGTLEYSTDLFDEATIQQLAVRYKVLLTGICADPTVPIRDLPLLTQTEHQQMLVAWNDTLVTYPADKTVQRLFEEQVERTPDVVAVCFENQALTYTQLNKKANKLAHYLLSLGVGPEVRVALAVERGLDMVVGLLGILKAGGAYVPLDPAYPADRLAYMLEDARPAVLVTQSALVSSLPTHAGCTLCLDRDEALFATCDVGNPPALHGSEDIVYVIYTSGSTGNPKGVQILQRALVNFLMSLSTQIRMRPDDTLLAVTSLSFDIAGLEIYGPLISGARTVIASTVAGENPEELQHLMDTHRITMMQATPATWRLLQAHGSTFRLRVAMCGGEALDPPLRRYLASTHSELWNLYGPTETTVWSTIARLDEKEPITLGRPIANTQVYLLDKWGRLVPRGVAGELHIGGAGLARGYLNRAELTQEKFIPDPFSSRTGARLYRTGDLARHRADGTLEFLGRMDHQVKLRGFRIELGEIEAVLQDAPDVAQAVAIVREDSPGDRRLIAYLKGCDAQAISCDVVHARLKARLPEYMLPSAYVVLDFFPLTANGKTDRKALPQPDVQRPGRTGYVAPRNDTERRLAAIWGALLLTTVGVHDNFFELGGHSLMAVQLLAQIRAEFKRDLPLRLIFDHPNIDAMAAHLANAPLDYSPDIPMVAPAEDFPATPAQAQLWYHYRLYPQSSAYNLVGSTDLPEYASAKDIQDLVDFLVARHDVLRTVFFEREGDIRQRVLERVEVKVREILLGQELARDAIRVDAVVPFDLERGPIFRALLVQNSDGRRTLYWSTHHIIFDGSSLDTLNRESQVLLEQIQAKRPMALPPVKLQFKDFAAWQAVKLTSEARSNGREYWASALSGDLPTLDLPFDYPATERKHTSGARYSCAVDADLVSALQELAQSQQATLFMALLAAWYVVLYRATNQTDLIVGTPVAGRPHPDLQDTIGFFVNTIMLRAKVDPQASFSSLLREVRAQTLDGLEYQDYPFDQLLHDLRIKRHPMRFPVSTVFFNMLNFGAHNHLLVDDRLGHAEVHQEMKFDLDIYIRTTGAQQLVFDCHYRTALFKPQTIEYLFKQYLALLGDLVVNDDARLDSLPVFESHSLPKTAPRALTLPERAIDRAASLAQCFRDVVRSDPNAVAVQTEGKCWTYHELDTASDALAKRLLQSSSGAGGRVALLLSHGWNAIVGMLSVLKAGMAYVPLDPGHPLERLRLIAVDAGVAAWVTDETNAVKAAMLAAQSPVMQLAALDTVEGSSEPSLLGSPSPEAQAYLIYTSGSTGRPKGVSQTNAAVLHYLRNYTEQLSIQPTDKYAALASYSFEAGVKSILGPLLTGATVCPLDLKGAGNFSSLGRFLGAVGITIWHSVPAVYRQFLREEMTRSYNYPSLRFVILSGDELLSTDLDLHFGSKLGGTTLVNLYGLTEASLNTLWKVSPDDAAPVRLGYPLREGEVLVLKSDGTPTHVYEPGEIVIDSPFVAKGYWGEPALSEDRFEYLENGNTRFRTGDLGRWLPDGGLQLCGRRGDQVKVNGYRIELGEIEAVALSHPSVHAAVALLSPAGNGERQLVLCIEAAAGSESAQPFFDATLKAHLLQNLPDYMVPTSVVLVDGIPRTPNGKVDRAALFPMKQATLVQKVAPRNALEQTLCTMVGEVLRIESVGIEDNFFDLGGQSLLAMQLISRVREVYEVDLGLQELFVSPTVAALSELIDIELRTRRVLSAPGAVTDHSDNYETFEF